MEEIHEPAVDITRCDCEYGTDKDGPEKVQEPRRTVVITNVGIGYGSKRGEWGGGRERRRRERGGGALGRRVTSARSPWPSRPSSALMLVTHQHQEPMRAGMAATSEQMATNMPPSSASAGEPSVLVTYRQGIRERGAGEWVESGQRV